MVKSRNEGKQDGMSTGTLIEHYFGKEGLLADALDNFEPREGQKQMAQAVAELLGKERRTENAAEILLVEAETGIGKTLAYLIPAVLSGKRIVISTATINLQDQILKKEIPLLEKLLDQAVSALCIKGRQNYLCHYRWFQYRSSARLNMFDDDSCDQIDEWLLTSETGDRSELAWLSDYSPLWPKISAHSHQCLGGDCPEASMCFVNRLKKRAGSARLLIVNHHLFFSDLALRSAGYGEVLPRYEGVIFDEAHHLENVASTFFGKSFSHYQVLDLIADIERQAEADLPPSHSDKMILSARGLRERIDRFLTLFPPAKGRFHLLDFIEECDGWYEEAKNLSSGLARIEDELAALRDFGDGWRVLVQRLRELHENLHEIALPDVVRPDGRYVHWYERRERSVALSITPIKIADNLRESLYQKVEFCLLTSATLTTAGNFSYFFDRMGLHENTATLRLHSPFDYKRQTCLYIPEREFPLPTEQGYQELLCRRIEKILRLSGGRALILCTSFKGMDNIADYLEEHLHYPLLVQGRASRHVLLQQFQDITESVLVAVASFWEGVDVPGESLSCLIIDKLPFEVPSDPVLQARIADIRDTGGNPFFDFQVPRAILSLRQGVGRLMRSSRDHGLIAIMDGRLYGKGYGRTFLASLPPSPVVRSLEEVAQFFEGFASSTETARI